MEDQERTAHGRALQISESLELIEEKAETPYGVLLRVGVAAVPWIGGPASLIIERKLAKADRERVERLIRRFDELENRVQSSVDEGADWSLPDSESLMEHAIRATVNAEDGYRGPIIANLVHSLRGSDPHEIKIHHLVDLASSLTKFELALLFNYAPDLDDQELSEFRLNLLNLGSDHKDLAEIRRYSTERMARFGLLDTSGHKPEVTSLGLSLLQSV